ncbi:hypothetical protein D6833_13625 [Candidatus Parcubacteria bacterium]|nr:MAG: hypothetical protein D6833_13625 [Candidatus Parcubacteria bacterium]
MKEAEFFLTRHTKKTKGQEASPEGYPGISESGIELAKERVGEILNLIESAPKGTIIPLVGVSPVERTRSTMKVYSEELRKVLEGRDDVVSISKEEIQELYKEKKGVHKTIEEIRKKVEENPEKKVVIEYPLALKALSDDRWWAPEDKGKPYGERKLGPYVDHLGGKEKFRKQRSEAIKQWFDEKGMVDGKQIGPNPTEVAEGHLKTLQRLEKFVHKIFPQKPLMIGIVGHSLEMDAFLTYLANNGEITSEGFDKIEGKEIQETELSRLTLKPDGGIALSYRGKNLEYHPRDNHEENNK